MAVHNLNYKILGVGVPLKVMIDMTMRSVQLGIQRSRMLLRAVGISLVILIVSRPNSVHIIFFTEEFYDL